MKIQIISVVFINIYFIDPVRHAGHINPLTATCLHHKVVQSSPLSDPISFLIPQRCSVLTSSLLAAPDKHSSTFCLYDLPLSNISYKQNLACGLLSLGFFTLACFGVSFHGVEYQYLTNVLFMGIFCCLDKLHFVYPFITYWIFELFLILVHIMLP